jgi:hypothetical protein
MAKVYRDCGFKWEHKSHPGDPHVCNRLKGHKGKHHCGGCGRER